MKFAPDSTGDRRILAPGALAQAGGEPRLPLGREPVRAPATHLGGVAVPVAALAATLLDVNGIGGRGRVGSGVCGDGHHFPGLGSGGRARFLWVGRVSLFYPARGSFLPRRCAADVAERAAVADPGAKKPRPVLPDRGSPVPVSHRSAHPFRTSDGSSIADRAVMCKDGFGNFYYSGFFA